MTNTPEHVIIAIQDKKKKGDFMLLTKENLEKLSKKIMDEMEDVSSGKASQYSFTINEIRLIQKLVDDAHNNICRD